MDEIRQGTTWRRQVLIQDGLGAPFDPTALVAVLCPETPITITQDSPGIYHVSLDEVATAGLTPGPAHWEMFARVGSDADQLVSENVLIVAACAKGLLP